MIVYYSGPIVTRKQARGAGLKRFFTGKTCPHGHICQRQTVNSQCVECKRAKDKKDYVADPKKHVEATQAWRSTKSKEEVSKLYKEQNGKRKQYFRDYGKTEKAKSQRKRYRDNNPDAIRAHWINRRSRVAAATGKHSGADIADIRRMQNDRCAQPECRRKLNGKGHVDHIIPIARGGTNDRRNLQMLCRACNQTKNAKDPVEFAREFGRFL